MTTPTPRTVRLRSGIETINGITGETAPTYSEYVLLEDYQRDLAASQAELAQERERADAAVKELEWRRSQDTERQREFFAERDLAERAEGKVERLLLESEAAHANLTALRDDRRRLQKALAFWMPCIASEDTPAGRRVAEEAFLLFGSRAEDDEPNAQELGWIVVNPEERIGLDDDGSLDEVVGVSGHLEQLDFNHWFVSIGNYAIWLHSRTKIAATYERREPIAAIAGEKNEHGHEREAMQRRERAYERGAPQDHQADAEHRAEHSANRNE